MEHIIHQLLMAAIDVDVRALTWKRSCGNWINFFINIIC